MARWITLPIAVFALATFVAASEAPVAATRSVSTQRAMAQPALLSGFDRFALLQITQMTTPTGPLFDPYLAHRIHGRSLNNLTVFTTLDQRLQRTAQQIVTAQIRSLAPFHITNGALVSIDLRPGCYGCILSMVGTAHVTTRYNQLNMAVVPRQPGSSFMPFDYLAGFERGLSPGTGVIDAPITIREPTVPGGYYAPTNYDHAYHGLQSLRLSLGDSFNIPAVKVEIYTTPKAVANTASRVGISALWKDNPHCCSYATALGGMERGVSLVQETAAYGAFETNGFRVMPISFKEIADRATGTVLWRATHDTVLTRRRVRVASAVNAYMITSILADNTARSREFGSNSPLVLNRPVAAKTGTTNGYTDSWTEGYTPQLVTGVWVGNTDDSPMVGATGITGAAPIWHNVMLRAFQILHLPVARFWRPPGLTIGSQCRPATRTPPRRGLFSFGPDLYPVGRTAYCTLPTVAGLHTPTN